ncbi:hypothetical protein [Pseudomonas vranovensis]|uniref:hypothetical protein n=1 Tax=Pseudomonas vranovensis TaxID=321661 RepID=UPI00048B4E7A|nr:hypothetical protein [Pseudomonas vranovensis]
MEVGKISLIDVFTLVFALLSLAVAWRALSRTKSNELFALRQSLVVKSEQARTGWYQLNRENESLIRRIGSYFRDNRPVAQELLNFLTGQREHLKQCISDAKALADDIHENVDKFSEEKCRIYLRQIDPSLEILARNQGMAEKRFDELLARIDEASTH